MKNKYKSKYPAKLRPSHQSKQTGSDSRWRESECHCSTCQHVNWNISADMWKIALLSAVAAFILYINTIYADFAYDDSRAILKNQDLKPETPISNIWFNDFWGTPLRHSGSHKSYRPLAVLTFRLNYLLHQLSPGGYHLVNVILHTITSVIYTLTIGLVIRRTFITVVAGLLFAIHPIHTEAVAGIVGRADVLCAIFFLLSLLTFIKYCELQSSESSLRHLWIVLTLALVTASTLSKEIGITALGVCATYYIFYHNRLSLRELLQPDKIKLIAEPIGLLLLFGVVLLTTRLYFMGYSPPSFSPADNPAADSDSILTRTLTFFYLPIFNFFLLVLPVTLSFDWSMEAIPLVNSLADCRVFSIILFYSGLLWLIKYCVCYFCRPIEECEKLLSPSPRHHKNGGLSDFKMNGIKNGGFHHLTSDTVTHRRCRKDSCSSAESSSFDENQNELCPALPNPHRHYATLFLGLSLLVLPFLPASNLFFYVGFVVAERVLYIPSMGFCLLIAEALYQLHKRIKREKNKTFLLQAFLIAVAALLCLRCYSRCLDWRSEEQLYRSGIAVNPAKAWGNLANILNNRGDIAGAEAAYRSALDHRGNMADVHYNLGILLQAQNRHKEALDEYNMAIKCRPRLTVAHLNRGIVLATLGSHAEAIKAYKDTTTIDTAGLKDPRMHETAKISALYNLGRLYAERKEYPLAISTYKLALARRPDHYPPPSIYNLLGEAYFYTGDLDKAESAYKNSLESKPNHLPAHLTMARLMNVKKQYHEAENWYKKALEIDQQDTQNYHHYALFLGEHNRHEEALTLWQTASSLSPNNFDVVFNLASALRQMGRTQDAAKEYEKAVSLAPMSPTAHMNLGAIYHMNKDYTLAEQSYTKALELDPSNQVAKNNLRKLQNVMRTSKR